MMLATSAELERIMADYKDTVWRVALSIVRDPHDAEDIFQDVFIRLMDSIGKIQSEEHLKAWLIRVTTNRCYSWTKRGWLKKTQSLDAWWEENGDWNLPSAGDDYTPAMDESFDPDMARTLMGERVMEEMQKLDRSSRIAVYLFYCENLSVREIASVLGMKENAVRTRLSRARSKIREGVTDNG